MDKNRDENEKDSKRSTHPPGNYRLGRKVHRALWELSEYDAVSRSAIVSRLVLQEYRRIFQKEPEDKW